ncbi:hypothetical protein CgunFtcFv8_014873 [Champsocephalus gunnari]|uniref:Uncharacterized protein n=1 Tax=Champsocephalus gunnari TaxID=52237 RepID=A0AAN8I0C1_CHAGU|nr:hypothetical protein CgunFtcFv8_014873 [Champsocephalus gunnari]
MSRVNAALGSVGACCVRFFLDSWYVPAWPGTSLGCPATVMTEGPWLGVTSCGSPGSEMCHQQGRPAGASLLLLLLGVFPLCRQAGRLVGVWMPFPESQGRAAHTLSPSDSRCAAKPHRDP